MGHEYGGFSIAWSAFTTTSLGPLVFGLAEGSGHGHCGVHIGCITIQKACVFSDISFCLNDFCDLDRGRIRL